MLPEESHSFLLRLKSIVRYPESEVCSAFNQVEFGIRNFSDCIVSMCLYSFLFNLHIESLF